MYRRPLMLFLFVLALAGLVAGGIYALGPKDRLERAGETVRIADGDSFAIGGRRIRLFGIDAPERGQSCADADGRRYDCGAAAGEALTRLIGNELPRCTERDRDSYGRSVAVCTVGGRELNRAMVAEGWAIAFTRYSRDYVGDEATARRARRGLWRGRFERPDQYRAGQRNGG